jgi:predicted Zn-dependent protease
MIEISAEIMTLAVDGDVIATARYSQHVAVDGKGAWIVSTHAARLFSRNQAITAQTLAERLAGGCGDDPFVKSWRAELFL